MIRLKNRDRQILYNESSHDAWPVGLGQAYSCPPYADQKLDFLSAPTPPRPPACLACPICVSNLSSFHEASVPQSRSFCPSYSFISCLNVLNSLNSHQIATLSLCPHLCLCFLSLCWHTVLAAWASALNAVLASCLFSFMPVLVSCLFSFIPVFASCLIPSSLPWLSLSLPFTWSPVFCHDPCLRCLSFCSHPCPCAFAFIPVLCACLPSSLHRLPIAVPSSLYWLKGWQIQRNRLGMDSVIPLNDKTYLSYANMYFFPTSWKKISARSLGTVYHVRVYGYMSMYHTVFTWYGHKNLVNTVLTAAVSDLHYSTLYSQRQCLI